MSKCWKALGWISFEIVFRYARDCFIKVLLFYLWPVSGNVAPLLCCQAHRVLLSSEPVTKALWKARRQNVTCVCVHRVGSGHYTAYGSHEGHWYHFNDSTVTLTNEDTVRKAKAYILFYVERAEQVASEKPATKSTATDNPAVETASMDSVSSK